MIITHFLEALAIPFQPLLGGQKPTLAWWNEEYLLLACLICCVYIVDGNSLTLHKRTHKHYIALVGQGGTRPTFGYDEIVCTTCVTPQIRGFR